MLIAVAPDAARYAIAALSLADLVAVRLWPVPASMPVIAMCQLPRQAGWIRSAIDVVKLPDEIKALGDTAYVLKRVPVAWRGDL
jgi:hypothetical protein